MCSLWGGGGCPYRGGVDGVEQQRQKVEEKELLIGRFKTGFLWLISLHLLLMPAIVGYIFVVSKKGNR